MKDVSEGEEPAQRLFRFPFGSCSPEGVAAANAAGSVVIQWDVVSGDPDGTSAATIERNVLSRVRAGSSERVDMATARLPEL